jgi:alpha-galactosidase/6-phospho-beta-glucosidase family protein
VKLPADFAVELREWVKRERGRPLFIASLSDFAAQALRREMQRLDLVVAGALPMDRAAGKDVEGGDDSRPSRRRPINAH